jgi:hypothetical protein
MNELLKITVAGLVVALAASPVLAQGANPKQEQQTPRNSSSESGPNQPSTTGTDSNSPSTSATPDSKDSATKGGAIRGENMPRGAVRDSGTPSSTTGGMSRDSNTSGTPTGSMSRDGNTTYGDHSRGMRGSKAGKMQVRHIQEALKAQGHDPGPVDGMMGPQTQEAIRAYQRAQNLTETGRLDAQTSEKLGIGSGSPSSSSAPSGSR